jgi:4-amino-4-deoxy-L-arabinose transferase-like glycosyltransferase
VAAVLRLIHLGDVPGNPFYDAAVHSMAGSWHAFIFGALDPSGGVSVDKPPVDLWLQVASVKLFGFNPTALKLPQALAGIASVPLLFDLVRRGLGRPAGLAAAAALAVLPVAVVTARSDTMDTFMAFLVLAAAWAVVRAIQSERAAWLLAAGGLIGLAFNVKLFQALLPVPALVLLWLVGSRLPLRRTLGRGFSAALVALVVAFAWIVPVALTPASQRPYPIGSTDGSIWNLVFVFNGIDRLHGRPVTTPDTLPPGTQVSAAIVKSQQQRSRHMSSAGPTRLFSARFGLWIGSELFPALAAAFGVVALWFARTRKRPNAVAVLLGSWLLLGVAAFSFMTSFHPRYFETVSPALAGTCGAAICALTLRGGRAGRLVAAAVMTATGIYVTSLGGTASTSGRVELVACLFVAIVLVATALQDVLSRGMVAAVTAAAVSAVLIVPAQASWNIAGTRQFDAERSGSMPDPWPRLIESYLLRHRDGTRYQFASIAPAKAAPLIMRDPQPVLMLTSYRSRPLISVRQLAADVRAGEVRFFLIGHRCSSALTRATAACPATARWAIAHSTDVTHALGLHHGHLVYRINYCAAAAARARARGRSARPSGRRRSAPNASHASPATCVPHPRA